MQSRTHRLTRFLGGLAVALAVAAVSAPAAPTPVPKLMLKAAAPAKPAPKAPPRAQPRTPSQPRRRTRAPQPQSKNHASARGAFKAVAARANASTVAIHCGGKQVALGAVVDAGGYVLTKASELLSSPQCRFRDGCTLAATIVGEDDRNDIALLKVSARGLTPIQWTDNGALPVGSWVVTPGLDDVPVSIGVVSVAARKGPGGRRSNRGFLGFSFSGPDTEARVGRVIPKTAAQQAGLKAGDLILKIDDKPVKDRAGLLGLLARTKAGQKITVRLKRGEKNLDVPAILGAYPAGGRVNPQQVMGGALSERRTGFDTIIQHDSILAPNQCGGAAVDADGKAVGINISRAGRVESYILPAALARKLVARLIAAQPPKVPATGNPGKKSKGEG